MRAVRSRPGLLLCTAALVVLSCSEPSAVGVDRSTAGPERDLLGWKSPVQGLWACSPLPYDSVTQTIGPEGGVIQVGPHTLSVPAGALDSSVAITAVAPSDTVNRIRFQPEGLTFHPRASLTMSYANCGVLGSLLPREIAYVDDSLAILDLLPSFDDLLSQSVTARLRHFSGYAVAW